MSVRKLACCTVVVQEGLYNVFMLLVLVTRNVFGSFFRLQANTSVTIKLAIYHATCTTTTTLFVPTNWKIEQ